MKRPRGRPKTRSEPLAKYLHVRCSPSWHEWANRLAAKDGLPLAEMVARLIEAHAKRKKFDPPPER